MLCLLHRIAHMYPLTTTYVHFYTPPFPFSFFLLYYRAIVSQKLGALASLGAGFTAYSRGTDSPFPFVAMNDFHQRAATARTLSSALAVESCFLVKPNERQQWEDFSTNHSGWYEAGFTYQEQLGYQVQERKTQAELANESSPEISYASGVANKIFTRTETFAGARVPIEYSEEHTLSCPIWQSSPVRASNFINYDRYTSFQ